MTDTNEHRCPNCNSTDLVLINTKLVVEELIECRSCTKLYQLGYGPDGVTERLVPV